MLTLLGTVASNGAPLAGATVVVSDEGEPVASGATDPSGTFALDVPPGRYTVRAWHPDAGGGQAVVEAGVPFVLDVGPAGCWGYVDLPDPAAITDPDFLSSWEVAALEPAPPGTTRYRWFWERPGAAPAVLALTFGPDGPVASVRARAPDGWEERAAPVRPRHARRLEVAIARSGFWELEHLDTRGLCRADPGGSAWTIEAWASPGYRAIYRLDPVGTPLATLGWAWTRAAGLRVRRRDFR